MKNCCRKNKQGPELLGKNKRKIAQRQGITTKEINVLND